MIGWNDKGEFVNAANKCKNCGRLMPLPEMGGKHCPACDYIAEKITHMDYVNKEKGGGKP